MTPWLLVDYGDVISLPYAEGVRSEVARRLELGDDELEARYWTDRLALDAGKASADYWSGVAGRPVGEEEAQQLDLVDLGGWAGVNEEVLAILEEQRAAGVCLALLSNAPHVQADAFDEVAWAEPFEHLFVSARLGLTKPDPRIFEHVLVELDADPADVTFVDDRPDNVAAAQAAGLRAIRFTGAAQLRVALA